VANETSTEKKKISKQSFLNALRVFKYIKPYSFLFSVGLFLLVVSGLLVRKEVKAKKVINSPIRKKTNEVK